MSKTIKIDGHVINMDETLKDYFKNISTTNLRALIDHISLDVEKFCLIKAFESAQDCLFYTNINLSHYLFTNFIDENDTVYVKDYDKLVANRVQELLSKYGLDVIINVTTDNHRETIVLLIKWS